MGLTWFTAVGVSPYALHYSQITQWTKNGSFWKAFEIACVASVSAGFGSKERDFWCIARAAILCSRTPQKRLLLRLPLKTTIIFTLPLKVPATARWPFNVFHPQSPRFRNTPRAFWVIRAADVLPPKSSRRLFMGRNRWIYSLVATLSTGDNSLTVFFRQ